MSTETPKTGQWLSLSCPRCKAKFRIKSAYGHMRGRCPNCGKLIEPPLPIPPLVPASLDLNEPLGLVPIEEEWPEPGQLEGDDDRPRYEFGSLPSQWAEPVAPKPPDMEGYGLQGGPAKPPPPLAMREDLPEAYSVGPQNAPLDLGQSPPESLPDAYTVDLPHAGPSSERVGGDIPTDDSTGIIAGAPTTPFEDSGRATQLPVPTRADEGKNEPERIPPPPPLPPSRPLWDGVYSFPWQAGCLKVWIFLGLEIAIFGFLVAFFYYLIYVRRMLDSEGFHPEAAILVLLIPIIVIIFVLAAAYGSANFMSAVEETAAGNQTFEGPELVGEWFGYLFYLLWIIFCTSLPSILIGILAAGVGGPDWGRLGAIPALLTFPTFLLSSLAGSSRLAVINGQVIRALLRNPRSVFVLLVVSACLAAICLELGYLTLTRFHILWALAMGFGWSTCLLIYARLLGRVGWVISQGGVKVKKRKRRRKKPAPGPDDWGGGMESVQVNKPAKL